MSYTQEFTEAHQFGPKLDPDQRVAGAYFTNWFQMQTNHRAVVILLTGDMAATATLNLVVQEAQDNTGTGAQAIAGKAITALTQAGGDANDTVVLEIRTEEMTPGYDFIRAVATVANAAVDFAVQVLGVVSRYPPVATANLTEIIH